MVNPQEWLDKKYPQETRSEITELNLFDKKLEGPLDLSDFVSLQELNLGFNPSLTGSLKFLKKLENLAKLYIAFTNFDSGLKYLPASLEKIYCLGTKLEEEFKNYQKPEDGYYDYQTWRKDRISEIEQKIIELKNSDVLEFCANTKESSNVSKVLVNSTVEKQSKINELKAQVCEYKAEIELLL